ncbi:MAG: hypothetical protein KA314_29255 [Chloroflexi bacterium]|nr:hypothetical protein [Chloroflexota bacterium]MBP8059947.1 hypothetical protein [Chloroflexota bacterium]
MMIPGSLTVYRCPASVLWVQDAAALIVVNETTQMTYRLEGFAAALWNWLALGYAYPRLMAFVMAWYALPASQARDLLQKQLDLWQEAGLLINET